MAKAIITNRKTGKESVVELIEWHSRFVIPSVYEFPTYIIKGRKTIWGTPKMISMLDNEVGKTLSPTNIPTTYVVKFI